VDNKVIQLVAVIVAPLLTWWGTDLLASRLKLSDDGNKAAGAALAALVVFAITWLLQDLRKWWGWYRRQFDRRAAFEGWWLQVHSEADGGSAGPDRAAVFSFLFTRADEPFRVEGNAFNSAGRLLAEWKSTRLFFSTDASNVTYLWEGKSFEQVPPIERKGTTTLSLIRGKRQPTSGYGEVLHLNQDRILTFRLKRVEPSMLRELLGRDAVNVADLGDFDTQKELAVAFLRRQSPAESNRQRSTRLEQLTRTPT